MESEVDNIKYLLQKIYSLKSERIGLIKIAETIDNNLAVDMSFEDEYDPDIDLLDKFIKTLEHINSIQTDYDSRPKTKDLYENGVIYDGEYPFPKELEGG